jgi:hypothetical protein
MLYNIKILVPQYRYRNLFKKSFNRVAHDSISIFLYPRLHIKELNKRIMFEFTVYIDSVRTITGIQKSYSTAVPYCCETNTRNSLFYKNTTNWDVPGVPPRVK